MPTPGSETYKSTNPLETRDKSTYSSRKLPELNPGPDVPDIPEMEVTPTVSAIEPDTLPVPSPDTEVVVTGAGFNENSKIMWNGSAEPTTYIDPEHLSTIVKPSTVEAELPFTLPVAVLNGSILSDPVEFTFTEPPEAPAPQTIATAGAPGNFSGHPAPAFADIDTTTPEPTTPWETGQYVVCSGGEWVYWDGGTWKTGAA